ncbi:MAG: type transport system permease protein [Actinomycetota bacterium]|nr:type transport system permease protein [Actinomycetota bacterium]
MNATVAQLTARSLFGRRRILLLLALPAVPLLLSLIVRMATGPDEQIARTLMQTLTLGTVLPLFALIAGSGAIGPEIDDGSIVYLLAKPIRRSEIMWSKLAVASASVVVLAAVPTFVTGLILAGTADRLALGYAVGVAVGGVTYCALFLMLSVLTRNAVVVGLVYALLWESMVGGFVSGAQALSVQQWALAVTEWIVGARAQALGVEAGVPLGAAVPLLLVVAIGSTWFAGQRLRSIRVTNEE